MRVNSISRRWVSACRQAFVWGALVALLATPAHADRKHASIVIDANTGATLSQAMADEPRYPASLTKMMTIYMAFEAIERGQATWSTRIKISERAAAAKPSKLNLDPDDTIALSDAIKALVVKSANDIAVAIAEHFGGTEEKFARAMTAKARQIGMRNTTFRNASGLPDDGQVTTARDMVTLGLRLQDDFPKHYPLFATREFTYAGRSYRSHNTLLGSYEGTDGIKTGYIAASGFNLVSNVKRGQKHIVGAVFGGPSAAQRNQTMRHLLNLGILKASTTKTRKPARPTQQPQSGPAIAQPAPQRAPVPRAPVPRAADRPAAVATVEPSSASPTFDVPTLAQGLQPTAVTRPKTEPSPIAVQQAPTLPSAPPSPQRGAAASTLQAQASQLTGNPKPTATPSAPRLGGPKVATRQVQIQVGAHRSKVDAERHIAAVRAKSGAVLTPFEALTTEGQSGSATVYRARFQGFSAQKATEICNDLRRAQIDCLVTQGD